MNDKAGGIPKTNHSNVKYPSTGQFHNAIHNLKSALTFAGVDENNNAVYDTTKELPLVDFVGTVKVHGTNVSLIMFEDQTIYCQSKERLLSFGYDNAGFWEAMQHIETKELFDKVKTQYLKLNNKEPEYPIIIAGEWAGKAIQKSVAVSEVDKFFIIFGIKIGNLWLPIEDYHINKPEDRIFHALDFPSYEDDTDYTASFTTDKDYVSKYPDGETEFVSYRINVGSVIPKSKKQKRIRNVLEILEYISNPEDVNNIEYMRDSIKHCIDQLKKCIKEK